MQVLKAHPEKDMVKNLSELMQLDMDAVEAYEQALKNIKTPEIHNKIESFRQDHVQHVEALSLLITELGERPPARGKDFKGFLIKGMTAIRSALNEKSALKAMKTNEELTNKTYKEALDHPLSSEARQLIEKNYMDEKRHLEYINAVLDSENAG